MKRQPIDRMGENICNHMSDNLNTVKLSTQCNTKKTKQVKDVNRNFLKAMQILNKDKARGSALLAMGGRGRGETKTTRIATIQNNSKFHGSSAGRGASYIASRPEKYCCQFGQ